MRAGEKKTVDNFRLKDTALNSIRDSYLTVPGRLGGRRERERGRGGGGGEGGEEK